MQIQRTPVLIFAQSGRFLAQSATQAGYTTWVADCFGDSDCLSVVDRWQALPSFQQLTRQTILMVLSKLTRGEHCSLICGSGIEYCYPMLFPLPDNIQLIGNTLDTLLTIKTPALFFNLLTRLGLDYPSTLFETPNDGLNWLKKTASGTGGGHIEYIKTNINQHDTNAYYQHFITGDSGSCLFLADGCNAQLLSINQQYSASNTQHPFLLGRIQSQWRLSTTHQDYLHEVINKLTASTSLVGLNSLDFIITKQNQLLILEINPRPSASAELIENSATLFQQHIQASLGQLPSPNQTLKPQKVSIFYHYATKDYCVPAKMIWPSECNDIPNKGITIKKNQPICTSKVDINQHYSAITLHRLIEQKILEQLTSTT